MKVLRCINNEGKLHFDGSVKDDRTGETSHHFHIKDEDVRRKDDGNEAKVKGPANDQSRGEIIKKLNRMFADLEEEYDSREQFIQTTADQEETHQHIVTHPAGNKTGKDKDFPETQSSDMDITETTKSINNEEIKVNENISENTVTEMMRYNPQKGLSKLNVGVIKYYLTWKIICNLA